MALNVPTLAFPLEIRCGDFVQVEQDSPGDVEGCVEAIVRCPRGYIESLPQMGLPDWTLTRGAPPVETVREAIQPYEPRASLLIDSTIEQLVATVTIDRQVNRGDQ